MHSKAKHHITSVATRSIVSSFPSGPSNYVYSSNDIHYKLYKTLLKTYSVKIKGDSSVYFDPTPTPDIEWDFRHLECDVRIAYNDGRFVTDKMNWCVILVCLFVASARASGSTCFFILFTIYHNYLVSKWHLLDLGR